MTSFQVPLKMYGAHVLMYFLKFPIAVYACHTSSSGNFTACICIPTPQHCLPTPAAETFAEVQRCKETSPGKSFPIFALLLG